MGTNGKKPPETKDFYKVRRSGGNGHARSGDRPEKRAPGIHGSVAPSWSQAEIAMLVEAVRALPDVRLEKVAAVRKAIESGTYVVDARKVAQKMIDETGWEGAASRS